MHGNLTWGAFHLRRLAGTVASKFGNAYLGYSRRCAFHLAMLAILVLPVKWKAPNVSCKLTFNSTAGPPDEGLLIF